MLPQISRITIITILAVVASCGSIPHSTQSPEQIVNKALGEGTQPVGRVATLPGAEWSDLPYVPVITPPEIVRIWIYDHVTPSNDLVVGHWIFTRLKDERWYIEEQWGDTPASKALLKKLPTPPHQAGDNGLQAIGASQKTVATPLATQGGKQ